ncbi:MAG: hypothetical protein M1838_000880, partial [Thelocarpon superellum]
TPTLPPRPLSHEAFAHSEGPFPHGDDASSLQLSQDQQRQPQPPGPAPVPSLDVVIAELEASSGEDRDAPAEVPRKADAPEAVELGDTEPSRDQTAAVELGDTEPSKRHSKTPPSLPGEDPTIGELHGQDSIDIGTVRWQNFPYPQEAEQLPAGASATVSRIVKQSLLRIWDGPVQPAELPTGRAAAAQDASIAPAQVPESYSTLEPVTRNVSVVITEPLTRETTKVAERPGNERVQSVGSAITQGTSSTGSRNDMHRLSLLSLSSRSSNTSLTADSIKSKSPSRSTKQAFVAGPMAFSTLYGPLGQTGGYTGERYVPPKLESPYGKKIKQFFRDRKGAGECASCLDDLKKRKLIPLACQHKYCEHCFSQLISASMTDESCFPARCCLQDIPIKLLEAHMTKEQKATYKGKVAEYAVPAGERWYCANTSCAKWINISDAYTDASTVICPSCGWRTCKICRGGPHDPGEDCPQDFGLEATLEESNRNGWQRCYQCHAMVELTAGCRHITCKCKAEFCYVCGSQWRTCGCTETDRAQREQELHQLQMARTQEERETAEAIAAVEEQERREAREAVRREQARAALEDARRAEERAAAARQDEVRLTALRHCIAQLRIDLLVLHKTQQQCLRARHAEELKTFSETQARSAAHHATTLDTTTTSLEESKTRTLAELHKRHQDERDAQAQRHEEEEDDAYIGIRTHLRGKPNREARERAAMDKVHVAQVEEKEALTTQHATELRTTLAQQDEELASARRTIYASRAEAIEREQEAQLRMRRAHVADAEWLQALLDVRSRLAGEVEPAVLGSGLDFATWDVRMAPTAFCWSKTNSTLAAAAAAAPS